MWKNYDTTDDETDEFYGYVVGYRNGYVIGYHNGTKAYHDSDDSDNSDSDSESESESESESSDGEYKNIDIYDFLLTCIGIVGMIHLIISSYIL
jgi:hypothetical protein